MKWLFILLLIGFTAGSLVSFIVGNARISLLDISVGLLVLGWLITQTDWKRRNITYLKICGPFIAVAVCSLLLAEMRLSTDQFFSSSLYLFRFVLYSSLLLVSLSNVIVQKLVRPGLFVAGCLIGIFGLIQYFLYPDLRNLWYLGWDPHAYRVFSTLLDPNFTALILVLTLIIGVDLISTRTYYKKFVVAGLISTISAFILTYSRGGYVTFLFVTVVYFLLKRWYLGIVGLVLSMLFIILLLPKPGGEGVNLFRTMSIVSRLENNNEAIKLFQQNPLLGVGFNTLRYTRLITPPSPSADLPQHSVAGFHNSWLFILATTGLVGLIAYFWIWREVLMQTYQKNEGIVALIKKNSSLVLTMLAIFVHSVFDNSLFYPQVMVWLWLLLGISLRKTST